MTFDWTHGPLAEGLHLYHSGEFFAAHEAWESIWLTAPAPEKAFLQALIQIAAACHHLQRDNLLGTARLLHTALRRLDPYPPNFAGIDTSLLRNDIRRCLETLAAVEATAPITPPRIHRLCP